MKNFKLFEKLWEHGRTLRRVGLVLVMCLIAIPQVWAYTISNSHIYYDNSFTNWSDTYIQVFIEKDGANGTCKSTGIGMSHIAHTDLFYVYISDWNSNDQDGLRFAETESDNWGFGWLSSYDRCTNAGAPFSARYEHVNLANWAHIFKNSSNTNGANISRIKDGANATSFNHTVTVGVKTKVGNNAFSSSVASVATISMQNYTFNSSEYGVVQDNYTTSVPTLAKGSTTTYKIYPAFTSNATFSFSNLTEGYYFVGWYDDSGNLLSSDPTFTKYTSSNYTIYAHFAEANVYVEGRFHVTNSSRDGTWTNTFDSGDWDDSSTRIKLNNYDGTKKAYYRHTYATPHELSTKIGNYDPVFYVKVSSSSSSVADAVSFWSSSSTTLSAANTKRALNRAGDVDNDNLKFDSEDDTGYAILYFDESDIWYELEHTVTYHTGTVASGTAPSDNNYYANGTTFTVKDNTGLMKRSDGTVFAGWATTEDASTVEYLPNATPTITANLDLYPVWKTGYYLIEPGTTTKDGTNFIAPLSLASGSYSVNDVTYSTYHYAFGGTSAATGVVQSDYHLIYDTKTNKTDISIYADGSSAGTLNYAIIKDGESPTTGTISVPTSGVEQRFHIDHDYKTRIIISCNGSTNPKICNIKAIETGTALAAPCTAGYQLSFPGRAGTAKNGTIDGITLKGSSNLTFGTGNKFEPSSPGTQYAQFTTTGAVKLQVTTTDTDPFYVCTNVLNPSTTGVEAGGSATTHSVDLSVAGTYYITPKSSNQVDITKIAFAAITTCTAPSSLAVSSITSTGATFTLEDEGNYEIYVNTTGSAPNASTAATYTITGGTTKTVEDLNANTTYYAWARTNCGYFNKSSWVALTGSYFTTTSSCSATADAGDDKATKTGKGVAMTATAATSGYTGAWSIKDSSPSTSTSQLSSTSAYNATFTPTAEGTYTLIWTVTDDTDGSCYAADEADVVVTAPSSDATFSSVTIGGETATISGSAGSYTAKIDRPHKGFSLTQDVTFTTNDANATVKLTNASGEVVTSVDDHNFGSGNLVLYVIAEDGTTTATYTVSITTFDKYMVYLTNTSSPSENIYSTLSSHASSNNYKLSVWDVSSDLSESNMENNYDLVVLAEAPGSGNTTAQTVGKVIGDVPVLSFKGFMFGKTNWPSGSGYNPGTGSSALKAITTKTPCHDIFDGLSLTGDSKDITILSSNPASGKNGVQLISGVSASGWRSLADKEISSTTYSALLEYVGTSGSNKALVIPISNDACGVISSATETIIGNAIDYLLDNSALYTINTNKTISAIHVEESDDSDITDNGDGTYSLESEDPIDEDDNAVTVTLSSSCASYSVDYSDLTDGYGNVTVTVTAESGATGTYALTVTAPVTCTDAELAYVVTEVNKTYGDAAFTNMLTNANSAVQYSSTVPAVATVNATTGQVTIVGAGSTTIKATIADDATYCDEEVSYSLVVSTAALPGTASTGTATSVTHNSATLPYTISDVTGVASVTIKVYQGESLVKTISGQSAVTSGSCSATGLSASTTYTYTITLIGDANHNDKAETSKSTSFTTTAAPTLTALEAGVGYTPANMIPDGYTISTSWQHAGGLSNNTKFYIVGNASDDKAETAEGIVEIKTNTSDRITVSETNYDDMCYFKNAPKSYTSYIPDARAVKFMLPARGGLYVIGSGSSTKLIKSGEETATTLSYTSNEATINNLSSGTYYMYATAKSQRIVYLQFDKAPEFVSSSPADGATDVEVEGTIVLTFDEAIASVDDSKFSLDGATLGDVEIDGSDATKVNVAYSGADGESTVTLSVAAGAVTDAAGNTSAALSEIAFTTESTGYTITHNDPTGSGTYTIQVNSETPTDDDTTAPEGATITLAASASTGYSFSSWTVTGATSGAITVTDNQFEMPAENVTVDATFAINSWTLTWDFDGGETSATEGTNYTAGGSVNYNTALTYPADNTMSKDGYDFNGWSSKPAKMPDDDLTITAQWAKLYRVDYNVMGGDALDPAYEMGSSVTTIDLPTPERSGYTFEGWYTTAGDLVDDDPYTPTADITLYAKWAGSCAGGGGSETIISVTISSNADNTSGTSASGTIGGTAYWKDLNGSGPYKLNVDNSSYVALRLATGYFASTDQLVITGANKHHYVYTGTHGSGSPLGVTDGPSDGVITYTLTDIPANTSEIYVYRPSSKTTYNGEVTSMSVTRGGSTCYTVTYNGNGATGGYVSDPAQYESGTTVYVYDAAGSYTRTGYEFNGWNTKADGSGTKLSSFTITRDTTLYAQWRIVISSDNTNFEGKDTPTAYKDVKVTNGATLTITNATTMRDVTVTNGATLKIQKGTTVHDITVETGSTLNISTTNGSSTGDGVTLAANSLALKGGWNDDKSKYDMPRVFIYPEKSTLTRTESVINFDISVDYTNYYPFALPFDVTINDDENVVDYAESYIAAASTYGMHYAIREYDGEQRAEGKAAWKYVPDGTTLKAGKGYILYAKTVGGKGIIRFPLNMPSAWTTLGEQGSYSAVTKNVVPVTAWGWDKDANDGEGAWKEGVPDSRKGWNLLGVPFMSCFATSDASHDEDVEGDAYIKGKLDFSTNKYDEDDDNIYVTVPVHDFSEYIQSPIDEAVLLPGWCFFIQVAKSGTLTFAQAGQEDDDNLPIYAPKREQENKPTVKTGIILSGNGASDKTTFLVSDKYSASEYEFNADLEKMFGENSFTLATYSLSGETRLAYNALSNADAANIIPIGYRAPADGEYTFSINPRYAESEAFEHVNLIDYETGIMTDLLMGSYTFSTERTQLDTRFALNVVPRKDTPTDIENGASGINDANGPRKVLIKDKMYIILDGKMYDATGKAVK